MRLDAGARRALVCACWALLLCAVRADAPAKRAESEFMSPMPFVLGSRYGRSQPRMIAPRNDRFFMGSRYGKRSEPPLPPARALLCEYAGAYQLYRCAPPPAPPALSRGVGEKSMRFTGRADDTRELDSVE